MQIAGAPQLTLGRCRMCLPRTTKLEVRTNTCRTVLYMHKTYRKLQIELSRHISTLLRDLIRQNETCNTQNHKTYTLTHIENAHCLM